MTSQPARPGSTRALRKLRLYVLARDQYVCQTCGCRLSTGDPSLPTHATLGHRRGAEWARTRTTSWNSEDYMAECARCNYSHGGQITGQLSTGTAELNAPPGW